MRRAPAIENPSSHATVTPGDLQASIRSFAIGALCVLTWALSHGYSGITHDARLYTLQALSHLHPDSLAHDIFLSYGSQDSYSIFAPAYALVIELLGPESGAAVVTLLSQLTLVACAWQLARRLMPLPLALLGVAVLIAIPGFYGADRVFTYIEPFLTPRMLAEALVLGSLAASSCERTRVALALLAVAVLIHPLMGAAGIAALLWKHIGIRQPLMAVVLIAATTFGLTILSYALPPGPWGRFDMVWLRLAQERTPYLFVLNWQIDDWVRASVPLATLAVGIGVLPGERARSLCRIVSLTAISGLMLTLIACDCLRLVLFTQAQPWRWLWLSAIMAAMLLPAIVHAAWQAGSAGRVTALLLMSSWIFLPDTLALKIALVAVASVVLMPRLRTSHARLVFFGAGGLLAIAVLWRVASNLVFTDTYYYDPSIPLWLRSWMSFTRDGAVPSAAAVLVCWLSVSVRGRPFAIAMAALATVACACVAPQTWKRWTHHDFPPPLQAHFMAWRALIPPRAEVFWGGAPEATWLLLERPSYLSVAQTAGLVFSRPAALEMARRASSFAIGVSPESFLRWDGNEAGVGFSPNQLELACATAQFQFLITGARLERRPLAQLPPEVWPVSGGLRLYSCAKRTET